MINSCNKNSQVIDNFKGAVGGGDSFGCGSVVNSSSASGGERERGSELYGSYGYAKVSPITNFDIMAMENNNKSSYTKSGAKTGTFTGGSFGGYSKNVLGYYGIKPSSKLPASSEPSLYIKPKMSHLHPRYYNDHGKYGNIEQKTIKGIPSPRIGNKYDNVNCNHSIKMKGPQNHIFIGPDYITDDNNDKVLVGYLDIPFDYQTLMEKNNYAIDLTNTIQNQLATQFMEKNNEKKQSVKEMFNSTKKHNNNNVIIILTVILIIYLLLTIEITEIEKKINF
jgi:hypothetical protein